MVRALAKAAASGLLLLSRAARVAAATPTTGSLSILSFNVAGLPQVLQSNEEDGDKATNTELIGSYFGAYAFDVIHVQEDFNYHAYLCKKKNPSSPAPSLVWSGLSPGSRDPSNSD